MKISVISSAHLKDGNRFACLPKDNPQEEKGVITTFESCKKSNYKKAKKPFGIGHLAGNCLIVQVMALYDSCVRYEVPCHCLLDIPSLTGGGKDKVLDYSLDIPGLVSGGGDVAFDDELAIPNLVSGGEDEVWEVSHDDLEMFDLVGGGEDNEAITSPPKKRRRRGKGRTRQIGRKPKSRNTSTEEELPLDKTMDIGNRDIGSVNKKDAWKDSPRGKASIAASHQKYEGSKKAHQTRLSYEASPGGMETRRIYEASPGGVETRKIYEASHGGMETRKIYEASPGGVETRKIYEASPGGMETRRSYNASTRRLETRSIYEATPGGMETRSIYEASPGGIETRRSYEASPGGMETRRIYEACPGGMATRHTYELLPERKDSKKRKESSEGYIETRRRYKSSQGRVESRKRYESKEEAQNTRRRYMSTEGRFVRMEYRASKVGHESHVRARKKYENSEENQKRKAYKMRVKRVIEHSNARALEKDRSTAAETEPGKSEPVERGANAADQSGKEPTFSQPEARNSRSNKDAMAIIRSHKVSYIATCKLEVEIKKCLILS